MRRELIAVLVLVAVLVAVAPPSRVVSAQPADIFAAIDRGFEEYRLDAHIPGIVYGVVIDGRLVHVKGLGVQDTRDEATRLGRHAVPDRLDDEGVHGTVDPEASR